MKMIEIAGATHRFGAPKDWDEATQGPCVTLPIREELHNGVKFMLSAHAFDDDDIARLQAGAPMILGISGSIHPVIFTYVDQPSKGWTFTNPFDQILAWAEARNLIKGSTPQAQMLKMTEEVGETAGAVARGQLDKIRDGIGDCVVVLTILAAQTGLDIRDCINAAYDEIKDRKGRMVDGIFIKEEALPETCPACAPQGICVGYDFENPCPVCTPAPATIQPDLTVAAQDGDDAPEPCHRCGGHGDVVAGETVSICHDCNGTGHAR